MAELEAAQAAAQAALLAEMDLLRRQKAAAEEQARRLETQVRQSANARLARLLCGGPDCSMRMGLAARGFVSQSSSSLDGSLLVATLLQLGELASALRSSREEVAAQVAAATAKDRENSQLWEQVKQPWHAGVYLHMPVPTIGSTLHWNFVHWGCTFNMFCVLCRLGVPQRSTMLSLQPRRPP